MIFMLGAKDRRVSGGAGGECRWGLGVGLQLADAVTAAV
jgi:hypothetical protein